MEKSQFSLKFQQQLQKSGKFTEILQKIKNFEFRSGAKVCESCRSRKMLKNDALVAKFGVDTAENEPSEV